MMSGSIIFMNRNLLIKYFSIDPASISVKKGLFSSKQHRSTRRNNSLPPGYLTSLVTRTNRNTIQTIGIYVRVFRTADHADRFSYHTGCRLNGLSLQFTLLHFILFLNFFLMF